MRIGIDNISPGESTAPGSPGGMRPYLRSLITHMARRAPQHEFVLLTPAWAGPLVDDAPANVMEVPLAGVPRGRPVRTVYQQTALVRAIAREQLDVFFATATVAPLAGQTPLVLAVQFTQYYDMPEAYGRARTAYLRLMLPLSLRRARTAIIFSEWAKRDLIRHTGVDAAKVCVIPHGLPEDIRAVALAAELPASTLAGRIGLELTGGRPYVLYISATYGYKNHLRLIRAFGALKRRTGLPHSLLLVGSEIHVPHAALRAEAEQAGVAGAVIVAGRVERAAPLYLDAAAAAVPTLCETFGYPVLEALAMGCPLLTSNRGSMTELAGDAALLVDPLDEAALADGLGRLLTDEPLRQALIARGRTRAAIYTWERAAGETLAVLEGAAGG